MNGFAIYETKLGLYKISYEENCITGIKFISEKVKDYGKRIVLTDKVSCQLNEYFLGKRKKFDFDFKLVGTTFQRSVWEALLTIPYGETKSYKDIAKQIGNINASRAVGLANNKNPIAIAVPCHRVIGASGKLVGYAGGLEIKENLLKLEEINKDSKI